MAPFRGAARGRNETLLVGPGLAPAKAVASVGATSFAKFR